DVDELHVRPDLDHLAGDLVPENETLRHGRATADHVLVGSADVRGDGPDDGAVRKLPSHVGRVDARTVLEFEVRIVDVDDVHLAWALVSDSSVRGHWLSPFGAGDVPPPSGCDGCLDHDPAAVPRPITGMHGSPRPN